MRDERAIATIFLASSHRLVGERGRFDDVVRRVGEVPAIARSFRVLPVRWERDAFGASSVRVNGSIQNAVDFDACTAIVVVVGDVLGPGTHDEYDRALALRRLHERPELFVYIRQQPAPSPAVAAFREAAFDAGVVAGPYESAAESGQLFSSST